MVPCTYFQCSQFLFCQSYLFCLTNSVLSWLRSFFNISKRTVRLLWYLRGQLVRLLQVRLAIRWRRQYYPRPITRHVNNRNSVKGVLQQCSHPKLSILETTCGFPMATAFSTHWESKTPVTSASHKPISLLCLQFINVAGHSFFCEHYIVNVKPDKFTDSQLWCFQLETAQV